MVRVASLALAALAFASPIGIMANPSTIVVARGGDHPAYVWDATEALSRLVASGATQEQMMHEVLRSALQAAASKPPIAGRPRDLTIRVVYAKTGAINPAYGAATMESVESLLTIVCVRKALTRGGLESASAKAAVGKGDPDVRVNVTGSLPPQH